MFNKLQPLMQQVLGNPEVANVMFHAVTQPINVNIAETVARPPKQLSL